MKNKYLVVFVLVPILSVVAADASEMKFKISDLKPYQGDTVRFELEKVKKKQKIRGKTRVSYQERMRFRVSAFGKVYEPFDYGNKLVVLVGVDYQLSPSTYPFTLTMYFPDYPDKERRAPGVFKVRKRYPSPTLEPPDRDPELQARIDEEKRRLENFFSMSSVFYPSGKSVFAYPVRISAFPIVTSPFGKKRSRYGRFRYHSGTDLRTLFDGKGKKRAAAVFPIADGLILETREYVLEGNTAIMDHGNGVRSAYFHLQNFNAPTGFNLRRNKSLGISGSSGVTTDAVHLHIMVTVHGAIVDPMKFLKAAMKK